MNYRHKQVGAAPRFGSAHLRLTAGVLPRDTAVEVAAARLPCRVEWHDGFRLSVDELQRHPEYRGQQYVDLGVAIAVDGWLTPKVVGDAVALGRYDDQDLKRVYHCLARFGGM